MKPWQLPTNTPFNLALKKMAIEANKTFPHVPIKTAEIAIEAAIYQLYEELCPPVYE